MLEDPRTPGKELDSTVLRVAKRIYQIQYPKADFDREFKLLMFKTLIIRSIECAEAVIMELLPERPLA